MKRISFINHLFMVAIITVIFGTIYATVQQVYRSGANDPQVQIVRDINLNLHKGKPVENFFSDTIDISQSLSSFLTLFDANGKPLFSSGFLNRRMPEMPKGVFGFARKYGEHQVTWEPQSGVRIAMVIATSNVSPVGFIASGRSLREVEAREHNNVTMIVFGWITGIGIILLHAGIQFYLRRAT